LQERQLQKELEEAKKVEKLAEEKKQKEQEQQDKAVGWVWMLMCAFFVDKRADAIIDAASDGYHIFIDHECEHLKMQF